MKKHLNPILIGLCIFGLQACSTERASYESYKQTAISNCAQQPTQTEYNFCVERAKMSAEEYRINRDKS